MPACTVKENDGVSPRKDTARYLFQVKVHRVCIGMRENHGCSSPSLGTDGTEKIG